MVRARIRLYEGKTRIWKAAGEFLRAATVLRKTQSREGCSQPKVGARPDQRAIQAVMVSRRSCTVSVPNLPPTSMPTTTTGVCELRVGLMSLAACCSIDSAAGLDIGTGVGLAEPRQGRHDRGVEGKLGPMPEGEAVRDNLDAPCIGYRHIDVHVVIFSNHRRV